MSPPRSLRLGLGLAALAIAAVVPLLPFFGKNLVAASVAAVAVLYAFGILSVVVLTGYVGQVSLCQATFMGISAFTTAAVVNQVPSIPYLGAAVIGVLVSFLFGVLVGLPALRLRGILLAIVTVGIALVFDYYFSIDGAFKWFNGGLSGWSITGTTLLGLDLNDLDFDHIMHIYWLLLVVFGVIAVLVVNLHDSGSGRRFRAIRESEIAAATMGVDLTRYKLLAFGLSAAVAGIGGAFFPLVEGRVTNEPFSFFHSLQFAAIAVLVGIRFVPAAFLGGIFISVFPELLNHAQDVIHRQIRGEWFNVALGILLIVQMISLPEGVWGQEAKRFEHIFQRLGRQKAPPLKVPAS